MARNTQQSENQSTGRKTSQSKDENQQQTQPTFDVESGNRTRATFGGRPAWEANAQPLRHPCSPLLLLVVYQEAPGTCIVSHLLYSDKM